MSHRCMLLLALLVAAAGCEQAAGSVRLTEVVGPTGGDALTVVSMGEQLVVPTDSGVFVSTNEKWQPQPGLGVGSTDPAAALQTLVRDGGQMNYPHDSLIARHEGALWLVSRLRGEVVLLRSESLGERWHEVPIPDFAGSQTPNVNEGEVAPPPIQAAEPPRLVTGNGGLFLVATSNVWRMRGTPDNPQWVSIGLDGLPVASEGLPPAIRNYLPRAAARPFEMMTVLAEQLLVFRRLEKDDPWVLTSTMAVVDREIVGHHASEAVFLVSPDMIQRTEDQGERWFRFWPEGYPRIEAFLLLPTDVEGQFDLLVGGVNGSIWRSDDVGATWKQTRPADLDNRSVTGFTRHSRGLWATTLGTGVLFSMDRGQSWAPRNVGLRAARPLDISFTNAGDILLASRAGLVQLSGDPDSGNWALIDEGATSAVAVDPISGRTVSGSITGALSTRADEGEPVTSPTPFTERQQFEFSPHQLTPTALPGAAVVSVNARDDGRRWLAWSHLHGGVKSEDGAQQWQPLALSDGLRAALGATTVRQVVAEASDTIYLLEQSRDARSPALLWRSDDDGSSWTTVHAFPRERGTAVLIRERPPNFPGVLFAAHDDRLLVSRDSGSSWTTIDGPWRGNRIIGLAVEEKRAALLLDARRRLEIAVIEDLDDPNTGMISRHIVKPVAEVPPDPEDITRFELFERRVLVTTKRRIWTGTLAEARASLGDGLAFLATLAGAVLLILVAFGFMRSAATSR